MKLNIILLTALTLSGCANSPEKVSRSTYEIISGTNRFKASTPKDHKIEKLQWGDLEIVGLDSSVNAGAVASQVQQLQFMQQLMNNYGQLAYQAWSKQNTMPQVVTNYIQLPGPVVTNYVPVAAFNQPTSNLPLATPTLTLPNGTIVVPAVTTIPTVTTNK